MYTAQLTIDRIQLLIKSRGYTQKKVYADCGINKNTINSMTDKKGISSFYLAKIADYLDCSVDYLLGRTNNPQLEGIEAYIAGDNNGIQAVKNNSVTLNNKSELEIQKLLDELSPSNRYRAIADIIDLINEKYKNIESEN